jgi:acetylornithine deacetylase/succinyl-diaminopimelate desuccinylase-like protein
MLKALNKLSQVEGRIEFHKTTKRMLRVLGNLEGGFKGWVIRHLHWPIFRPLLRRQIEKEPLFGAVLQNTAVLSNIFNPPGPPNQISSRATIFMDCRLLPETKIKKFIRDIKYGLFEPRFKVSIINQCPEADESSPDMPEYKAFARAIENTFPGSVTMPILFPASSDNNYFRQFEIPTFGVTPVLLSRQGLESIHGPNESLRIAALWKGAEVFFRLVQELRPHPPKLHFTPFYPR